jgi:hypothetical protein
VLVILFTILVEAWLDRLFEDDLSDILYILIKYNKIE